MVCMHFDTINGKQEETESAKSNQDIVNTEVMEREYEDNNNEVNGMMVDNKGLFDGNKKRFFQYSKRDEKQVFNTDFCRVEI